MKPTALALALAHGLICAILLNMSAAQLRIGALGPALLFAGAATVAVGALLWARHGGAIFREMLLSGLPLCL